MDGFTPDAIPDVADIRTGLVQRLERHRVLVLGGLALLIGGSLALLALRAAHREKEDALRTSYHAIVDDFSSGNGMLPDPPTAAAQARKLEELRPEAKGSEIEPLLLLQLGIRWSVAGEDAKAMAAVEELKRDFPESPVLQIPSFDDERTSLASRLEASARRHADFTRGLKIVEPKPDLATYALVETDLGAMKIGFYPDLAPKHVQAFLALAKKGGFNGTQVYSVRPGEWIELGGGDRTRNGDPRDDRDDDPAMSIAPEDGARCFVRHRRRMVTSVGLLSGDQDDRFAIVLSEKRPEFDSLRTPFGELLDDASAGVADRLANVMTFSKDATKIGRKEERDFPNTPSKPVLVRRVSIWKDGALAEGHSWDTARVTTDQREPGQGTEEKDEKDPEKDGK